MFSTGFGWIDLVLILWSCNHLLQPLGTLTLDHSVSVDDSLLIYIFFFPKGGPCHGTFRISLPLRIRRRRALQKCLRRALEMHPWPLHVETLFPCDVYRRIGVPLFRRRCRTIQKPLNRAASISLSPLHVVTNSSVPLFQRFFWNCVERKVLH